MSYVVSVKESSKKLGAIAVPGGLAVADGLMTLGSVAGPVGLVVAGGAAAATGIAVYADKRLRHRRAAHKTVSGSVRRMTSPAKGLAKGLGSGNGKRFGGGLSSRGKNSSGVLPKRTMGNSPASHRGVFGKKNQNTGRSKGSSLMRPKTSRSGVGAKGKGTTGLGKGLKTAAARSARPAKGSLFGHGARTGLKGAKMARKSGVGFGSSSSPLRRELRRAGKQAARATRRGVKAGWRGAAHAVSKGGIARRGISAARRGIGHARRNASKYGALRAAGKTLAKIAQSWIDPKARPQPVKADDAVTQRMAALAKAAEKPAVVISPTDTAPIRIGPEPLGVTPVPRPGLPFSSAADTYVKGMSMYNPFLSSIEAIRTDVAKFHPSVGRHVEQYLEGLVEHLEATKHALKGGAIKITDNIPLNGGVDDYLKTIADHIGGVQAHVQDALIKLKAAHESDFARINSEDSRMDAWDRSRNRDF